MINWFNMPAEGLSNGGQFEIKELTATENKTYEKDGEVYNKVTVNVEGGGGSSDFSTAEVTITSEAERWECGLNVPAIISDTLNIYNEIYENTTLNVVLYKGSCIGVIYSETMVVGVSGNATLDGEYITITGNCIITLSQK